MSERYFVIKRILSSNNRPIGIRLELIDTEVNKTTPIGGQIDTRMAATIGDWLDDGGLDGLITALKSETPEVEPAPIEIAPEDWAKLDTPLDKPFPPPMLTREQTQALIELADERIFAKARDADRDQPERRRTYDEILAELRERLLAGEKVVVPYIYPSLSLRDTWDIAQNLRELTKLEPSCGVLHDTYHNGAEVTA